LQAYKDYKKFFKEIRVLLLTFGIFFNSFFDVFQRAYHGACSVEDASDSVGASDCAAAACSA
jgi:hypothetical protein